jgi:hypothetical protein
MVPADYENWMEKLAADGWNIDKIGQWSSIRMVFKKQIRNNIGTSLTFIPVKADYLETTANLVGIVGQMASCFIWRKEYTCYPS